MPPRQTPERRCILSGESAPKAGLLRFVMGPDGLVPDVAAKLPGRGIWMSCDREKIETAIGDGSIVKAISRSLKTGVKRTDIPDDLAGMCERLLRKRCLDRIGLEQRAGHLVTGFDKIKAALSKSGKSKGPSPEASVLLAASDGGEDGRKKIQAAVGASVGADVPAVDIFSREELSLALGRENVVHVLLYSSGGTVELANDVKRLQGLL